MDETWANSNKKMVALQAEGWGHSTDSTASFHLSSNNYGPSSWVLETHKKLCRSHPDSHSPPRQQEQQPRPPPVRRFLSLLWNPEMG